MRSEPTNRSIPELLRELSTETATLVRQEMQLAQAELMERVAPARASAVSFGATAIFGLGAFGAGTAFLIAVIALALPVWASALIVTFVYGVIALILAFNGKEKLRQAGPPLAPQTAQTIKDDIAWVKTRNKSETR